ncbi:MAG: hypothetical protein ACI83D_000582 [Planctomycetota bacterium]|jgi:hypothetical protein
MFVTFINLPERIMAALINFTNNELIILFI